MGNLIKQVSLSKKQLVVGESLRVDVQVSDPSADVMIDGVYGARQYLQFRNPGSYTVVVTAALGDQVDQAGESVDVSIQNPDVVKYPIIWAGQDRYQPRMVVFSLANADGELSKVREYKWNFGDGAHGASRDGGVSHDYTEALVRDRLYTDFDVQVEALYDNGFVSTAKRTVSVFNTYGFNKIRERVLTPRVSVQNALTIPASFFMPGEVICSFTVTNLEDEEISFTAEKQEWLTADPSDNPANIAATGIARESLAHVPATTPSIAATRIQVAPSATSLDLRVPARSTITIVRVFPPEAFTGTVFGVAIHLSGIGMCSKLPAISSAYIEVKLPMQWSGLVVDSNDSRVLSFLARNSALARDVVTHQDLSEYFRRANVAQILYPSAAPAASLSTTVKPNQETRPPAYPGLPATVKAISLLETNGRLLIPRCPTSPIRTWCPLTIQLQSLARSATPTMCRIICRMAWSAS